MRRAAGQVEAEPARRARHPHRLLWSLLVLPVGFAVGLALLDFTPVLAGLCPQCFGFQEARDGIYLEVEDPEARSDFLRDYDLARSRVDEAFGADGPQPRVLVCFTKTCNSIMGGHDVHGLTFGAVLMYLAPQGRTPAIIAHELAHVALHDRIGLRAQRTFPAWVDEGIATYVSQDARFDLSARTCRPPADPLPVSAAQWRRLAGADHGRASTALYGGAACRVAQWVKAHPISGFDKLIAEHVGGGQ